MSKEQCTVVVSKSIPPVLYNYAMISLSELENLGSLKMKVSLFSVNMN